MPDPDEAFILCVFILRNDAKSWLSALPTSALPMKHFYYRPLLLVSRCSIKIGIKYLVDVFKEVIMRLTCNTNKDV